MIVTKDVQLHLGTLKAISNYRIIIEKKRNTISRTNESLHQELSQTLNGLRFALVFKIFFHCQFNFHYKNFNSWIFSVDICQLNYNWNDRHPRNSTPYFDNCTSEFICILCILSHQLLSHLLQTVFNKRSFPLKNLLITQEYSFIVPGT